MRGYFFLFYTISVNNSGGFGLVSVGLVGAAG